MPVYTQAQVFEEVAAITQDGGYTRWTPHMLNSFLNAGIREIALNKPNAVATEKTIALVAGIHQDLADPDFALIRAIRNVGGAAITEVTRGIMDGMVPGWADPAIYPETDAVDHVMFDPAEPSSFHVFPANTGAGQIVAVVASIPDALADGATQDSAPTYTAPIPLQEIYRQALVDFVISKCFTVDSEAPNSAQRAQMHYAMFANAIGIKFRMESMASPKTTNAPNPAGG